jgi:hypothetical protein
MFMFLLHEFVIRKVVHKAQKSSVRNEGQTHWNSEWQHVTLFSRFGMLPISARTGYRCDTFREEVLCVRACEFVANRDVRTSRNFLN